MVATSIITRGNRTTIPKAVVEALKLKAGDTLIYEIADGEVRLRKDARRLIDLAGRFAGFGKRRKRPVTIAEMHEAVARGAVKSFMSGLRRQAPAERHSDHG